MILLRLKKLTAVIITALAVLSPAAWCEDLDALSLEECLRLALSNHPSLRQAKGATRGAAAQLEQARAENRVKVTATGSLGYDGDYEDWDGRYHSESAGLTASKTLYDTGRNRLKKEMQSETLKAARQNERQSQATVAASAKRAYYDLVLKVLNRDVEREKLHNLEEHLKSAKGLYEVGQSAFIDVTRAEADAASARVSLLKAENDIQISQEALKVAMGLSDAGTFDLALSTELLLPHPAGSLEELMETALSDRPDYLQALHTLRARELGVSSAARDGSPTITGQATSSFSKLEGSSSLENYGFRVSLNVPIVDGGATAAAVESARAQVDQQTAAVDSLRQQIAYGVRSAALSLTNATQRVRSSEASVRYAEENLELAQGRYDVGVGNAIELSDAVSQLASARYAYYQALYDAQAARADLDEAMGHLPPELNGVVESNDNGGE